MRRRHAPGYLIVLAERSPWSLHGLKKRHGKRRRLVVCSTASLCVIFVISPAVARAEELPLSSGSAAAIRFCPNQRIRHPCAAIAQS